MSLRHLCINSENIQGVLECIVEQKNSTLKLYNFNIRTLNIVCIGGPESLSTIVVLSSWWPLGLRS